MQYSSVPENSDLPKEDQPGSTLPPDLHADKDGRNKEWEDRARVNLESVPEGTQTSLERDFEPEQDAPRKPENPAY